jgi:hypothetical protein
MRPSGRRLEKRGKINKKDETSVKLYSPHGTHAPITKREIEHLQIAAEAETCRRY